MADAGHHRQPGPVADLLLRDEPRRRQDATETGPRLETILRSYGIAHPTLAEQKAYARVLDRMGAFAASERAALAEAGFL